MARGRRKSGNPMSAGVEPGLDISSLIDVAFLLLIYFIVTTTLTKSEADLSMVLPGISSDQSTSVKVDQMVVRVAADQGVFVNDELVDGDPNDRVLPNLADRLERYAASAQVAGSEPMVIVDCANEAPQQRFIDVLNACTRAGLKNVSLTQ
jgi:biopolymer transport protein ExbD